MFFKALILFAPYLYKNRKNLNLTIITIFLVVLDITIHNKLAPAGKLLVENLNSSVPFAMFTAAGFWASFWLLNKSFSYILSIVFFPVINNAILDITRRLNANIHSTPFEDYKKLSIPQIISQMKRISLASRFFLKSITISLIPTIFKFFTALILYTQYWGLQWPLLVVLISSMCILYWGLKYYMVIRKQAWQATDLSTARIFDSMTHSAQARYNTTFEFENIQSYLNNEYKLWNKANILLNFIHIHIDLLIGIFFFFALFSAGIKVQKGLMSIPEFIFFKGGLLAIFLPLRDMYRESRNLLESTVDIKNIITFLESKNLLSDDIISHKTFKPVQNKIHNLNKKLICLKLDKVSFSYANQKSLFKDLTLEILHGEKILLQGPSGEGKSTLAQIMAGLIEPSQGAVQIYNESFDTTSLENHKNTIHYLSQKNDIFEQNLKFNLTYGIENVDKKKLHQLMTVFQLNHLVDQWGYEGEILKHNVLSGGEIQRLALVRALLHDPEILILDESLRSIDPAMRTTITEFILKSIPTVIMISHDEIDWGLFDKVYHLIEGKLIEKNTPPRPRLINKKIITR